MYFQQIFWCLYNKGSDLAGDIRLKKKNHMQARALEYATFPQKWRQEGRRRGWGWQKKSKKRTPEQMAEVKRAMALRCPDLKAWKFASCFCLNFVEKLWIGIRKKTQPSAWLSCKQCFREQTIHTLTLFLFLFFFVSRRCHMSSHTEHSDQHEQTPKKGTSAKSGKPRIRPATVRL